MVTFHLTSYTLHTEYVRNLWNNELHAVPLTQAYTRFKLDNCFSRFHSYGCVTTSNIQNINKKHQNTTSVILVKLNMQSCLLLPI